VAFDLAESENQHFLLDVNTALFPPPAPAPAAEGEGEGKEESKEQAPAQPAAPQAEEEDWSTRPVPEGAHADYWKRKRQIKAVLVDGFSIDLTLDFLYRQNNTDLLILKNIKVSGKPVIPPCHFHASRYAQSLIDCAVVVQNAIENRNSVLHGATIVTHG
jgi:hypothetical protein